MPDPREWLVRTEEQGTGHRTFGECSPQSRSFAQQTLLTLDYTLRS